MKKCILTSEAIQEAGLSTCVLCMGMEMALRDIPDNGENDEQGLYVSVGWEGEEAHAPKTGPKILGVNYRPHVGDDLVCNFCPWCGTRLRKEAP